MKANGNTDILLAGVGGQGIVLASGILANICLAAGYDIKQSEVHGMAQRGGSVTSHVRFGEKVSSPTIAQGEADYMLGFELLESLRWTDFLAPDGVAIVNTQKIDPITVSSGAVDYPDDLEERIRARCNQPVLMDAFTIAQEAGSARAVNIALLGGLSKYLDFPLEVWEEGIRNRVPPKTFATNWKAFTAGREL
jgi:indolepyruvate ferredoxin oxidoreductase, beta subunit